MTDIVELCSPYKATLGDVANSDFLPIPQLNRTDADVTLIMLQNWALYTEPVLDLLFKATVLETQSESDYYRPYFPISIMGCTEQHQTCNPNNNECTPLTGMTALGNIDMSTIGFNEQQLAISRHIYIAITNNDIQTMLERLGTSALQASLSETNAQGVHSGPLPSDQWVQEVWGWQSFLMAHLQRLMYDYAAGPTIPSFVNWIEPPDAKDQAIFNVCTHTKIRDASFYNFSEFLVTSSSIYCHITDYTVYAGLFGLALILTVGSAVVLLNLCLSTVVGLVQRITKKGFHCRDDWNLDHALQVQRMAYENARMGHWKGREALVPVTMLGERFGKPTISSAGGTTAMSPLFSPGSNSSYSPYTTMGGDGYPFMKPEQEIGITVRENRY